MASRGPLRRPPFPRPTRFDRPQEFRAGDGTVLASVRTLQEAVDQLRRLGRPFLDWTGKAERLSFDVPTLPLFVHQRIYMDPPYGVKFGSNFQPFVRRRDASHNDDADMTREPEMVKAYGTLCRELRAPSGSTFVQISDENLHHYGRMFWLRRKKFVGSYVRLSALSRSYFASP